MMKLSFGVKKKKKYLTGKRRIHILTYYTITKNFQMNFKSFILKLFARKNVLASRNIKYLKQKLYNYIISK